MRGRSEFSITSPFVSSSSASPVSASETSSSAGSSLDVSSSTGFTEDGGDHLHAFACCCRLLCALMPSRSALSLKIESAQYSRMSNVTLTTNCPILRTYTHISRLTNINYIRRFDLDYRQCCLYLLVATTGSNWHFEPHAPAGESFRRVYHHALQPISQDILLTSFRQDPREKRAIVLDRLHVLHSDSQPRKRSHGNVDRKAVSFRYVDSPIVVIGVYEVEAELSTKEGAGPETKGVRAPRKRNNLDVWVPGKWFRLNATL